MQISRSHFIMQSMTKFWLSLIFLLTAPLAIPSPYLLISARADQNPTPTSVGLYNYSTVTVSTSTSTALLARNVYRAGLIIQNNGGVSVVIKPGSVPANATDGIVLTAGSILQINPPPVDALYGQSASSTAKVILIENIK